jgi:D-alanyl-D-alanine carboxypeptidase/D-alanyl-D-alanine-endopeptidase (penicillin-binding protein 4)
MNWNSINVFVRPGAKSGDPALVFADPYSNYIKLVNNVKTSGKVATINLERIDGKKGDTLRVSGNIPAGSSEIVKYVSISQPDYWTGEYLKEFLKQRGVTITGDVSVGKTPGSAKVLAKVESRPMFEILSDMMKFSNNFVAEMLTKQFAIKMGQPQGNMTAGLLAISNAIKKRGLTSGDFNLTSPSGLSQKNKIKPKKLGEILVGMHRDFKTFPEFASSFPIGGVDGTLKSRLKGTKAEGRVRGKTGLLNGAVGLAGFAGRPDGTTLSYVFIYNGSADVTRIWSLFDQMAVVLLE